MATYRARCEAGDPMTKIVVTYEVIDVWEAA